MLDGLLSYVAERSTQDLWRDVLDVLVVYYLFYRVSLVMRGTRAIQVSVGMAALFVLYVVAQQLQLISLLNLLSVILASTPLLIVVVFQSDIRRALMRVGSGAWFGSARSQEAQVIDAVVDAATELARHRTGAIITFEQDANLDEFVGANKGHTLDAAVSRELLVSLFIPEAMNKLHDGAVIIRDLRIAKAGVFFPMPDAKVADESFGSRHRAALGITEETDAVVVVVSEERGSISFCFNGNIVSGLDGPRLRSALEGVFSPKRRAKGDPRKQPKPLPTAPTVETEIEATPAPISTAPEEVETSRPAHVRVTAAPVEPVESEPEESPTPLRKSRSEGSDSEPPPPLRKSRSETEEEAGEPGRSSGAPLEPVPASLKRPRREGAPADAAPASTDEEAQSDATAPRVEASAGGRPSRGPAVATPLRVPVSPRPEGSRRRIRPTDTSAKVARTEDEPPNPDSSPHGEDR